MLQVSIFASK